VTIQGVSAAVSSANAFQGGLPVVPGTNVFTVEARDGSGNTAAAQYEVDITNAPKTFTYDANGNLTADGTRTFEWDARNQLVAVNVGTYRSEFTYDGERRRVRVLEKQNGVTQSDTKVVWCEQEICEERAADGTTVTRRAFERAEQVAGAARFLVEDHLGSVAGVTDGTSAVLTRYAFDPWGRRTVTAGSDTTSTGYTGHRWQSAANVFLALYRAYDPELGRWLSEDPAGRADGLNLALYVRGNPVRFNDELGLLRTVGFPADKQKDVDDAIDAIREKLKCGNCAGPDTDRLRDLVDNPGTIIKYNPKMKDCGLTGPMTVLKLNRTFSVGPNAWNCCSNTNDPKTSLASTILHELAHRGDRGEKRPRELEESCFGCKN
jgi:RHS repeat-associated protein